MENETYKLREFKNRIYIEFEKPSSSFTIKPISLPDKLAPNATKQDISRSCLSANGYVYGPYWSYKLFEMFIPNGDSRKKGVIQLDMNGNKIDEFGSVAEATQKTGLSKTCISRVCRGERESSGEFIWKYID
jgi:hypothetical protein